MMQIDNSMLISDYFKSKGIITLYHFTDRANIQSIIDNGGIYSWQSCQENGIAVKRPGGDATSHSIDSYKGLGKYVRLCFTRNHPMMYVAKNDGRISDPVVLRIDLSVADLPGALFSDVNAARNSATVASGLSGAINIHVSTVRQPDHFNLTAEEKPYYQAEVLVYDKVPLGCIKNIDYYKPKPVVVATKSPATYTSTPAPRTTYTPTYKPSTPTYSSRSSSGSSDSGGSGCLVFFVIAGLILLLAALGS